MMRSIRPVLFAGALLLSACATQQRSSAPLDASGSREPNFAGWREVGALKMENIPPVPDDLRARIAQFQSSRSARLVDWHPDGWMLVSTRFANTSQLHRVRQPLGARFQLTFDEEPVSSATILPDGKSMIFSRDIGGNENGQFFSYDFASGRQSMLTDGVSRHGGLAMSRKSPIAAYSSNERNGTDTDIWLRDFGAGSPARLLVAEGGSWSPDDITDSGDRLLVGKYTSVTDSMVWFCDGATGGLTPLVDLPEGTHASIGNARFSRSGDGAVFYLSDEGSEHQRLLRRASDGSTKVLTSDIDWEVEGYTLSDDGKWLAFTTNEGGTSSAYLLDLATMDRRAIPTEPALLGGLSFSPDSTRLALTINGPTSPGDVYVVDAATLAKTRWTESEAGGLDTSTFTVPRRVEVSSFDGLKFDAWYNKPKGAGPFPVVVDFHGGPEGQSRPWFSPYNQFLVGELGIAVISPNVRGSTGYGKSFVELDNGMKREDSVKDGGAVLDWIAKQPELDASRVAVTGGSYGGYMTLAMLTTYPDRIKAGICSVGIANFVTFLENTSGYRRDLRRAEYGDERDPAMRAFFDRISPVHHARKVKSALFLIHGINDPRVPWGESEQFGAAAKKNGAEVWTLLATNEGHGFSKKENIVIQQQCTALFLKTYLGAAK